MSEGAGSRLRDWRTVAAIVAGILPLLFVASLYFPAEYQICQPAEYTHQKDCASHHLGPFVLLWIITNADAHNGLVSAIAGAFVAGFTATLWWVGKPQLSAFQEQIRLARDEFISTHRPRIVARDFRIIADCEDHPHGGAEFMIVNIGETAACDVAISTRLVTSRDVLAWTPRRAPFKVGPTRLVSGEGRLWVAPFRGDARKEGSGMPDSDNIVSMFLVGMVAYSDERNVSREMGFIRICTTRGIWERPEEPGDYEYSY